MIDFLIGTAWAQSAGGAPSASAQFTQMAVMMVLFIGIYYFVAIRPQQKQQEAHQKLIASVQKGDDVITSSGLHGKVAEVEDRTIQIEVSKGVRLRWEKSRIAQVRRGGESAPTSEESKG